ncbi:hypothetical protein [Magnetococcus marinus]|nr:hypothetical protein [Magnetococcus marinus]
MRFLLGVVLSLLVGCTALPQYEPRPMEQLVVVLESGKRVPLSDLLPKPVMAAAATLPGDGVGLDSLEENRDSLRRAYEKVGWGSLLTRMDLARVPFIERCLHYDLNGDYLVDQWEFQQAWVVWGAELALGEKLPPGALQWQHDGVQTPLNGLALSNWDSRRLRYWLEMLGQQQPAAEVARTLDAVNLLIESSKPRYEYGDDSPVS